MKADVSLMQSTRQTGFKVWRRKCLPDTLAVCTRFAEFFVSMAYGVSLGVDAAHQNELRIDHFTNESFDLTRAHG